MASAGSSRRFLPTCSAFRTPPHEEVIDRLAQPLLTQASKILEQDIENCGHRKFNYWYERGSKEYLITSYSDKFFRAGYVMNRLTKSAVFVYRALDIICKKQSDFKDFMLNLLTSVVTVGCGPGSDIVGTLAFLESLHHHDSKPNRLVYFIIDQCSDWFEYISVMDRAWAPRGVSLWFKPGKIVKASDIVILPPGDMIVFCLLETALLEPEVWGLLASRYRFVLVVEIIRESLMETFSAMQYESFQINSKTMCFYKFSTNSSSD